MRSRRITERKKRRERNEKSGILIGFGVAAAALVVLVSSMVVTYPDEYRLVKQSGRS